jgi:hypothetical protein
MVTTNFCSSTPNACRMSRQARACCHRQVSVRLAPEGAHLAFLQPCAFEMEDMLISITHDSGGDGVQVRAVTCEKKEL